MTEEEHHMHTSFSISYNRTHNVKLNVIRRKLHHKNKINLKTWNLDFWSF